MPEVTSKTKFTPPDRPDSTDKTIASGSVNWAEGDVAVTRNRVLPAYLLLPLPACALLHITLHVRGPCSRDVGGGSSQDGEVGQVQRTWWKCVR